MSNITVRWFSEIDEVPKEMWAQEFDGTLGWDYNLQKSLGPRSFTNHLGIRVSQRHYGVAFEEKKPVGMILANESEYIQGFKELFTSDPLLYTLPMVRVLPESKTKEVIRRALIESLVKKGQELDVNSVSNNTLLPNEFDSIYIFQKLGFELYRDYFESCYIPLFKDIPYPKCLRGNYSRVLNKNYERLQAMGLQVINTKRGDLEDFYRMYQAIAVKNELESGFVKNVLRLNLNFFKDILSDNDFTMFQVKDSKDELLAFNISYFKNEVATSLIVGMSRERISLLEDSNIIAPIYQVMHSEMIKHSQGLGARWVYLSTAAVKGKQKLGALITSTIYAEKILKPFQREDVIDEPDAVTPGRPLKTKVIAALQKLNDQELICLHTKSP